MNTTIRAGIGLVLLFGGCAVTMHVVQPELSPVDDAMSYYMNGRLGWVFGLGLVALGTGSLCIAYALHALHALTGQRLGSVLFVLWGCGAVVGGLFAPDPRGHWDEPPSLSGVIHGGAAMVALMAFPAAAVLLSRRLASSPATFGASRLLRPVAWLSAASLLAFLLCLAPAIVANRAPYVLGLVERVLMLAYMIWIVAAAMSVKGSHT
jgi:hypothetical protein